jgi:hypothetical protein
MGCGCGKKQLKNAVKKIIKLPKMPNPKQVRKALIKIM